jgi:hypothetical protein
VSEQEFQELMRQSQQLKLLLESFTKEYRPLLLSLIERQAALRLRAWSTELVDTIQRRILLACAEQKEEIARRIEALFPNALAIENEITDSVPEVTHVSQQLFRPVRMQARLATQALVDRICVNAYRELAEREGFEQARQTLISCAVLESKAAEGIEGMLKAAA